MFLVSFTTFSLLCIFMKVQVVCIFTVASGLYKPCSSLKSYLSQ